MADYGVKYRIEYYRKSGGQTTIDILEKDLVESSITNLLASADPLEIAFDGDINNIYKPTVGSGATIKIMAIPLSLQSLFTDDPLKYMVRIYNGTSEDSSGASNLVWQGFVNTGIYNESYSIPISLKSPITVNCNDGMTILDVLYYKQSDGNFYIGTNTIGGVINNIINKLGLLFNNIYTSNDLTTNQSNHNLFLNLKVNNEDYIDENLAAMSCREVLDSILGGIPLVMRFIGSDMYIIDPINLHDTGKGKAYTLPEFAESVSVLGGYLDISSDAIRWRETGGQLDIVSQVNEVNVKYDPYTIIGIASDFNDEDNLTYPGSWSDQTGWWYNNNPVFLHWAQSAGTHRIGVKETATDDPIFAVYLTNTDDTITFTPDLSSIYQDSELSMKITMDAFFQTKVNSANIFSGAFAMNEIYAYYIQFAIKIGDQYWKDDYWEAGETGNYKTLFAVRDWVISDSQYVADNSSSQVGDTWAIAQKTITLPSSLIGGSITFIIYDYWTSGMVTRRYLLPLYYGILLKNFKIEFLNTLTGKVIDNSGIVKKGNINTNLIYKKDITTIEIKNGTGIYGISRAAYMNTSNAIISGLYRDGNSTIHDTAELIIQSFLSQYKVPRLKLVGTLAVQDYLLDIFMKLIQDTNYQDPSAKAFYIVSGTYYDREEKMEVMMIELSSIREGIV